MPLDIFDIGNIWCQQVDDYTNYTIPNRCNVPNNTFVYPFSTHKKKKGKRRKTLFKEKLFL